MRPKGYVQNPPARGDGLPLFLSTTKKHVMGVASRYRLAIAYGIMIASSFLLVSVLNAPQQGDMPLYRGVANDLLAGTIPYRDRVVEYPPYAIGIFAIPRLFGEGEYMAGFMLVGMLVDTLIKGLLFLVGFRFLKALRSLLPLACYAAAVPFIHFFYLTRYDLWPALISLAGLLFFCSQRYSLSGLMVAVGIGVKLYPVVFVPPLVILAARQGRGRQFVAGIVAGLLPIAALSFVVPWWRFAQFHTARGLQVESLYASMLWLGKQFGLGGVSWTWANSCWEVQGGLAVAVLPWARGMFVGAVGLSTVVAMWAAARCEQPSVARLARLLLVPLLGFVGFNQVLSPQYMIWLLPLAALGSLEGSPWTVLAISLATALTPIFYPVREYFGPGLSLFQTAALLVRNITLITVWVLLMRECFCRPINGNSLATVAEIPRLARHEAGLGTPGSGY